MSIERLVELREPDIGWGHLWTGRHEVRGTKYELHGCRVVVEGQLRIYVFQKGEYVAYLFDPEHDATCAHGSTIESQNTDDLISTAIEDINANALGMH